jgi:hypothetical protein
MSITRRTKTKTAFAFLVIAIIALIGASCGAPAQPTRFIEVDQHVQVGDVGVTIELVRLSAEELLVLYQVTVPDDVFTEGPLGAPTIEYGGQTIRGSSSEVDGLGLLSFPPLPDNVEEFTINIRPYLQLNGPAADFSIFLGDQVGTTPPPQEGRELQVDQLIEVDGVQFRLTSFILYPDSFEFTYQPEPGSETAGLLLAGPGERFETISATDDSGHSYIAGMGGGTYLNFDEGYPQLKSQTIEFDSALQPGTTRLDVRISVTGTIGTEPFRFLIQTHPSHPLEK